PRLGPLYPGDEDRGAEAGADGRRLRRRIRWRAPRRGEEPRQGARLLVSLLDPRLGPQEPAPRALVALQHPGQAWGIDSRLSAFELDRARHLAIHPGGEDRDCAALLCGEAAGGRAERPADYGRRRPYAPQAR